MEPMGPSGTGSDSKTRIWPAGLAVVLLAGVLGVAGALLLVRVLGSEDPAGGSSRRGGDRAPVQLEPATYRTPQPFTDSVVTLSDEELVAASPAAIARSTGGPVRGDTALLYGTRRSRPACDVVRLAQLLTEDAAVTRAWAGVAGVSPDEVEETVLSLTPVLLTADTAVTNHTYGAGEARALQSILQAGTPVLIDDRGAPRVQCSCGNPLLSPDQGSERPTTGTEWDHFDPKQVIQIEPADRPVERIPVMDLDAGEELDIPLGGSAVLDGVLVQTDDQVLVIDEGGVRVPVLDEPVSAVFDDGAGGLVYTLAPSDVPDGEWPQHVPADSRQTVIWHLAAGSIDAVSLTGEADPEIWHHLLGVGQLGGRTYVVFAPLTIELVYDTQPTLSGPLVVMDLENGERTELFEHAFGWEEHVGDVTFGGNMLAMESGYSGPLWHLFDEDLQPIDNICGITALESTGEPPEHCPYGGALDENGMLITFGSDQYGTSSIDVDETAVSIDLRSGEIEEVAPLAYQRDPHSMAAIVQARNGQLSALFSFPGEDPVPSGRLIDLTSGEVVAPPDDLLEATRSVRMLDAPLLRPLAPQLSATTTTTATAPSVDEVDVMSMTLPKGSCLDYLERPAGPFELVDGVAQTGPDPAAEDYVGVEVTTESSAVLDLDGDGSSELVVSVVCHWGGSGFSTNVVPLSVDEQGDVISAGPVLLDYFREHRTADVLSAEGGGVLVVSGNEWLDGDAACCPSSSFTDRWGLRDGVWVRH